MVTLYKTDTKNKIRVVNISTEGDELIQESGLIDGALIQHRKVCSPKNVGRSNETTGEQQAILEMNSKIAEKLTEGYFKTLEECEATEVILPMLAKDYKKESHKINWKEKNFAQQKMDGMRCLAHIKSGTCTLISRDGKVITTVNHLVDLFKTYPTDIVLDGELYCHGASFQENMKLIKKYRPGETENVSFHIYDIVDTKKTYTDRRLIINEVLDFFNSSGNKSTIVEVPAYPIENESDLKAFHGQFMELGYEGSMVRTGKGMYKVNGRSSDLLKYKDFLDIALPILDIIPCRQRPQWGEPVFEWKGAKGHRTGDDRIGAGMKFSHAERIEMLANKEKYVGKTAELRFFEHSDTGVPRFPVMVGIRLDK